MHTAPASGPLAGQLLHLLHCVCLALYNVYTRKCKLCKVLKIVAGSGSDAGGGPAAAWRPAWPRAPHTTASPIAQSCHPPSPRRRCGHRCPGWGLSIENVSCKAHSVEMVLKPHFVQPCAWALGKYLHLNSICLSLPRSTPQSSR